MSWILWLHSKVTHPDSGLGEVGPGWDLLSGRHVRVAVPLEGRLELLQLLGREVRALTALSPPPCTTAASSPGPAGPAGPLPLPAAPAAVLSRVVPGVVPRRKGPRSPGRRLLLPPASPGPYRRRSLQHKADKVREYTAGLYRHMGLKVMVEIVEPKVSCNLKGEV